MVRQSKAQHSTVERVMHEFKAGELESGSGVRVKSRRQAVAIALHEAGASNQESAETNQKNLRKTKAKEAKGATAKAATEAETLPGKTLPGKTSPGKTSPGKTSPGKTSPGKSRPPKATARRLPAPKPAGKKAVRSSAK